MSPDELQRAWQAHAPRPRVTMDAGALLKQVRRSQQEFGQGILLRDIVEAGLSMLLIPVWVVMGMALSLPWTWHLMIPALLWISGFIIVDRMRQRRRSSQPGEPLLRCLEESAVQVEHQIRLLRSVAWWYLTPLAIPMLVFFVHVAWSRTSDWLTAAAVAGSNSLFVVALYAFLYYLNQRAVRKQLEPRHEELLVMIASLKDDQAGEMNGDFPILMQARDADCARPRWRACAVALFLFLVSLAIAATLFAFGYFVILPYGQEYPRKSPFGAVQWRETQPEVEVDGEWHSLVALDGIPAAEIVAFSQQTYGTLWQKRFEEDLVKVLTRMGRPPGKTVALEVQSLDASERRTLEEVPMTSANRRAIRKAAQAREAQIERDQVPPAAAPDPSDSFAAALESIRAPHKLPAMAAFALRDGVIIEQAIVGTRSTKDETPVAPGAQWHLGSNTKAMTATVAGMLVEDGFLAWDATVGEILGEAAPDMDAAHRDTTLAMLLQHTSGIQANISWYTAPDDRVACAARILASPPSEPAGGYAYSNAGYVVAGAMMEVVKGKRWEELMRERLFDPLGMTDTGFGAPSRPGSPWGHRGGWFRWTPMDPAWRGADNAPVLGPAGTVHATLEDYARFLAAHLAGARGEDGLVSADTFATLHTPPDGGDYSLGWIVTERSWAGGRALAHGGSNTLWNTTAWIAPEKDMAFFAATNAGGDPAFAAVDKAVAALIDRHLANQGRAKVEPPPHEESEGTEPTPDAASSPRPL